MGTEIQYKNVFPGYYSMRNANDDSSSSSWHLFNTLTNNHCYDGFTPRNVTDAYSGQDKDGLKQKMLQHEAIFKDQVYELHRIYRKQRDMMEEVKRKDFYKYHISIDTSSSSSLMPSQNPHCPKTIFGADISNSPLSCSKGNGSKDCEVVDCRPSKVRKKLFDLQFPAHENIEPEEAEHTVDNRIMRPNGLADLNEPICGQDVEFLGPAAKPSGFSNLPFEGNSNRDGLSSCPREPGNGRSNMNQTSQIPFLFSAPSAYPFTGTSDTGNSWGPPWGKSNDSLTHKLTYFQTHPSFLSSHKNHEVFRDRRYTNVIGFNGSASKELFARVHSVGFESQKIYKGSSFIDLTGSTNNMDLNSVQNLSNGDNNSRNCDQILPPWLTAKSVTCKNGDRLGDVAQQKDDPLGADKRLLGGLTSTSIEHRGIDINVAWDDDMDKQIDINKDVEIKNHFDLNSCVTEDDNLLVTESFKTSKKRTMEIDLEAPAVSEIDEEDEHKETELKPDHPESKELEKIAAEAIVAISSQQAAIEDDSYNVDNPLLWFVDVINSCEKNIASATCEIDEFEMLTLQLDETKEEDYMPTPLVPDFEEPDEVVPDLTGCRPRRGQARRGRPRRDFQRDILPGMTSLSRHEITEDLQIFGGLMRATGHSWNLGSTRRNGKRQGVRGRRKVKAVETTSAVTMSPLKVSSPSKQVNSVEVLGLDERSLTGWGKTTRRPRRQRCAASNSVAVQLT